MGGMAVAMEDFNDEMRKTFAEVDAEMKNPPGSSGRALQLTRILGPAVRSRTSAAAVRASASAAVRA